MIGAGARGERVTRLRTDHVARSTLVMLAALLGTGPALAQSWRIIPSIGVSETLTDNVALAPDDKKRSDLITQITPGVQVSGTSGRLRLSANYRATALLYANTSDQNDVLHYLESNGTYEAVQNWLFIDARASISQQATSAFAAQPNLAPENINANRAQTFTYQISPYVRGRLTNGAQYQVRYSLTGSNVGGNQVGGSQVGDSYVEDWLATLTSIPLRYGFEWSLTGGYQVVHPSEGRDLSSRRVYGSLTYHIDPQLTATLLSGWESNDYAGPNSQSAVTYGAQLQWAPTERTKFDALAERRPFTNTYRFGFQHRTRLTAWQASESKTVTTLPAQLALGRTTAFDLLFDAFASQIPDPVERTAEVNRQLQVNGIPRDFALATVFVTSGAVVQRARQLSVAVLGVRNTVTLAANLTNSEAIVNGVPASVDFVRNSEVEQRSFTGSWAFRLSPITSINLLASHLRTTGNSAPPTQETTEKAARLSLTHQLSPRMSGTLGARYIWFDSSTSPGFREKALLASLLVTFY